jgi:hypothetical protein
MGENYINSNRVSCYCKLSRKINVALRHQSRITHLGITALVRSLNNLMQKRDPVNLIWADTMNYLEVWKSKSAWVRASNEEQALLITRLRTLLQSYREYRASDGPFAQWKDKSCLLVWGVPPEAADLLLVEYRRIRLHPFFERLMYGDLDMTAGEYVARLGKRD